jgi:hypothetical protein
MGWVFAVILLCQSLLCTKCQAADHISHCPLQPVGPWITNLIAQGTAPVCLVVPISITVLCDMDVQSREPVLWRWRTGHRLEQHVQHNSQPGRHDSHSADGSPSWQHVSRHHHSRTGGQPARCDVTGRSVVTGESLLQQHLAEVHTAPFVLCRTCKQQAA